jgi:thiamine biosynthesis lipoprotein
MYNQDDLNSITSSFKNEIIELHKNIDAYYPYENINNIYYINQKKENIKISESLYQLISDGILLTKLTKGKFNLAMGSTIDLWKTKFDENKTYNSSPYLDDINNSLKSIPSYEEIEKYVILNSDQTITLKDVDPNVPTLLNLGGIAKGYAIDQCVSLFNDLPAIISGGTSSIHLNGDFPSKTRNYYNITLKEPKYHNSDSTSSFCTFKIDGNMNISTSGDYEKCFYDNLDGNLRSHIINPETGYSSSYHSQICVYSSLDGVYLDGLSTALMNIEKKEDIKELISSFETYFDCEINYAIFDRINSNNQDQYQLYCSKNFYQALDTSYSKSIINITII